MEALSKAMNYRNNYNKDCSFCQHEQGPNDPDNENCDGCSILRDSCCSCHINPPCSKCVDSAFEPSGNLINYKHYREGGKWKWECFKSDEQTFKKLTALEGKGYELSTEMLQEGVIAVYLGFDENEDIELCERSEFKKTVNKIIDKTTI
jgi:hypothetical protein